MIPKQIVPEIDIATFSLYFMQFLSFDLLLLPLLFLWCCCFKFLFSSSTFDYFAIQTLAGSIYFHFLFVPFNRSHSARSYRLLIIRRIHYKFAQTVGWLRFMHNKREAKPACDKRKKRVNFKSFELKPNRGFVTATDNKRNTDELDKA